MKPELNILRATGYLIIAFWLTHAYLLYPTPFQNSSFDGLNKLIIETYDLSETSRKYSQFEGISKEEALRDLKVSTYISWLRYLVVVVTGIISGYLITKRKKLGRTIAIILFSILLFQRLWLEVQYFKSFALIIPKYKIFIKDMPFQAIYQSIISPFVYLLAVIFLLTKRFNGLFLLE